MYWHYPSWFKKALLLNSLMAHCAHNEWNWYLLLENYNLESKMSPTLGLKFHQIPGEAAGRQHQPSWSGDIQPSQQAELSNAKPINLPSEL